MDMELEFKTWVSSESCSARHVRVCADKEVGGSLAILESRTTRCALQGYDAAVCR